MSESKGSGEAEVALLAVATANRLDKTPIRVVSPESAEMFRAQLIAYRASLLAHEDGASSCGSGFFTGDDLACEFPIELIDLVVKDANIIRDRDQLIQNYHFFSIEHANHVWKCFTDIILANSTHDLRQAVAGINLSDILDVSDEETTTDDEATSDDITSSSESEPGRVELDSDLFESSEDGSTDSEATCSD